MPRLYEMLLGTLSDIDSDISKQKKEELLT